MPYCTFTQLPIAVGESYTVATVHKDALFREQAPSYLFQKTSMITSGVVTLYESTGSRYYVRCYFASRSWSWLIARFGYQFQGTAERVRFEKMLEESLLRHCPNPEEAFHWHVILWAMYRVYGKSIFAGDLLPTLRTEEERQTALLEQRVMLEFALAEVSRKSAQVL